MTTELSDLKNQLCEKQDEIDNLSYLNEELRKGLDQKDEEENSKEKKISKLKK